MNIKNLFKRINISSNDSRGRLPLVQLLGYEKSYGTPQPQDYDSMVKSYISWVYACAWKNATSVAKAKLKMYRKIVSGDKGKEEEIEEHPLLDLVNNVNPFMNGFELKTLTQINLELTGNAYWYIPRDVMRIPNQIWNIPSNWVKIIPSKTKFVEGYVVRVPNSPKEIPFDEKEIIHFKFPSPFSLFYGGSPTFAAAFGVDLNKHIKTWGINFFMNNAQPSGVLMTDTGLNNEQYSRLRDNWNRKYRGSNNAGKIAILESGLKYQNIGSSIKDANFEFVNREVRDEILAMFGVPASKLGLVEDVNRANADANDYTYAKETVLPRLTLIEEKLNEKFVPMYTEEAKVRFENVVPEDKEFMLREKEANIRIGFSSIDEERQKEGLEPLNLPETSVPLISFGQVPVGTPKPDLNFNNNSDDEDKDDNKKSIHVPKIKALSDKWDVFVRLTEPQERLMKGIMQRFFANQHSEVMRRLSKYKAMKKDVYTNIMFNMDDANFELERMIKENVKQAFVSGMQLGFMETSVSFDLDMYEPNVLRKVNTRVKFVVEKTNGTTDKMIEQAIEQGIKNGESIDKIASRIDKVYSYSDMTRSRRIAQTEVIGGTNEGMLETYELAGVKRKRWLTARDEKVRHAHRNVDGVEVGIKETFHLVDEKGRSAELLYAGDRTSGAPASFVINCRCTVNPSL